VHSGEEAIRRLRNEEFDAMTLDILLGDMSGFEVLREVRDDPELSRLPIVVVSVLSGGEALAGEWVVSKPIDSAELVDAVGSAVLAGRSRVLVVGRAVSRTTVAPALERLGIEYDWATSGAQAARLCQDRRFEVALVDAGLRSLGAVLSQLDLRGRRLRRTVIVFSTGQDSPGLARLDAQPVPVEDATNAVLAALGGTRGG
jgi:CheY-like chemotaxis protein